VLFSRGSGREGRVVGWLGRVGVEEGEVGGVSDVNMSAREILRRCDGVGFR